MCVGSIANTSGILSHLDEDQGGIQADCVGSIANTSRIISHLDKDQGGIQAECVSAALLIPLAYYLILIKIRVAYKQNVCRQHC